MKQLCIYIPIPTFWKRVWNFLWNNICHCLGVTSFCYGCLTGDVVCSYFSISKRWEISCSAWIFYRDVIVCIVIFKREYLLITLSWSIVSTRSVPESTTSTNIVVRYTCEIREVSGFNPARDSTAFFHIIYVKLKRLLASIIFKSVTMRPAYVTRTYAPVGIYPGWWWMCIEVYISALLVDSKMQPTIVSEKFVIVTITLGRIYPFIIIAVRIICRCGKSKIYGKTPCPTRYIEVVVTYQRQWFITIGGWESWAWSIFEDGDRVSSNHYFIGRHVVNKLVFFIKC